MTKTEKDKIKQDIVESLSSNNEVERIIIFGSFIKKDEPDDIDIAVFSPSPKDYLSLAMEYRRRLRGISRKLSLDVVPVKMPCEESSFLNEIKNGELVYEKRD